MSALRRHLPNVLSLLRLLGTPVLFMLVRREPVTWFVVGYAIVALTDYLDGALARAWDQTSALGARLDSVADIVFYLSTAYFGVVLFPDYLLPSLPLVWVCVALLAVQIVASRIMLGRVLMPHTHLSRFAGVLAVVAFFLSFVMNTTWAFRVVVLLYGLSFAEMIVMFRLRRDVDADTRGVFAGRRSR